MTIDVSPDVAAIVRPQSWVMGDLRIVDRDPRLDEALERARAALAARADLEPTIAAVRMMYKRLGIDPTKTRPSSEALLRRIRKGDALPRINSLVDVVNWCSVESQLPYGIYDADRIHGSAALRVGRAGESYAGIRKDTVHVDGRLTLVDTNGPFGNPTSDSARTMVTTATTRALVVIYTPAQVDASIAARVASMTRERIAEYCT